MEVERQLLPVDSLLGPPHWAAVGEGETTSWFIQGNYTHVSAMSAIHLKQMLLGKEAVYYYLNTVATN